MDEPIRIDRVLVNKKGEAVPYKRAIEMGIVPTRIFVRDDGWTLGAPDYLHATARGLWQKEWKEEIEL